MTRVLILSIIVGVYCTLAEKSEFITTTELSKKYPAGDQLLSNIVRAKNSSQLTVNKITEEELKKTDKKPRTVLHRDSTYDSKDNSSCCGIKYSSSGSARPDRDYHKVPVETGRYPSRFGDRHPIDRYGWLAQIRPLSSTASGNRPGGGSGGGGGGGNYGGNYDGSAHAGSQSGGDRYVPRPIYGSETANRPNAVGYGYGGYKRPSGYGGGSGYGITGTLADGDEFSFGEPPLPEGNGPQHPGNIHTQKAVALKALAGVALIGAAAALASNPVLLPIGIVGRRKRSEFPEEVNSDVQMEYILTMLRENLTKIRKDGSSNRVVVSPSCVARLTCEIQKDYLNNFEDVEVLNTNRRWYLNDLIRNNVLGAASVNANVKNLIKLAMRFASQNKSCNTFICNYLKKG